MYENEKNNSDWFSFFSIHPAILIYIALVKYVQSSSHPIKIVAASFSLRKKK